VSQSGFDVAPDNLLKRYAERSAIRLSHLSIRIRDTESGTCGSYTDCRLLDSVLLMVQKKSLKKGGAGWILFAGYRTLGLIGLLLPSTKSSRFDSFWTSAVRLWDPESKAPTKPKRGKPTP
jgi:hypothetical protein